MDQEKISEELSKWMKSQHPEIAGVAVKHAADLLTSAFMAGYQVGIREGYYDALKEVTLLILKNAEKEIG